MEIFYVYALRSLKDLKIYVGMTQNIEIRLSEHNKGKTKSTKGCKPWELIFVKEVRGRSEARTLEKYYKSGTGKEYLKSLDLSKGPVVQRIE